MSYVKTQWVNGDTITADKLNHIEAGIEANETEISLVKSQISEIYPTKDALVSVLNKNRYDGRTYPGYLDSNGHIVSGSDWVTTSLIFVGDLANIICSGNTIASNTRSNVGLAFICTYDQHGDFIEQVGTNYGERYTVTSGVSYIRFSYHYDIFNQIQIESGASRTDYVVFDWSVLPDMAIQTKITSETAKAVTDAIEDSFKSRCGKNRFNGITTAGYLNSSGSVVSGSDWVTTDYIYVGDIYEIICSGNTIASGTRSNVNLSFICTYGYDKSFIEQVGTNYAERYIVTSGVAYIRFCYHADTFNQIQVESGYNRTSYEAYTEKSIYDKKWYGVNWTAVGDSLTEVNARTTMHYHDYIASATGINVTNMGVSGTGYAKGKDTSQAFYQRISSVPISSDVITIFGSGNDGSSGLSIGDPTDTGVSTLCGCVNTTLDNLFTVLPLANVGIIAPTPWIDSPPSNTTNWMSQYTDALKQICNLRGIPFLDLYHCSALRPWEASYRSLCYSKDEGNGVHPDETGHRIIASKIEAFLDTLLLH